MQCQQKVETKLFKSCGLKPEYHDVVILTDVNVYTPTRTKSFCVHL